MWWPKRASLQNLFRGSSAAGRLNLLQVLQAQSDPHVGVSPTALLAVIGRNMAGRLQVAAPGADLDQPAQPVEVAALLKGDNSEAALVALVREHATSGVSGVVPKFLDAQSTDGSPLVPHKKANQRRGGGCGPQVRHAMAQHPGFEEIGKRMLTAWAEGVQGQRGQRVYAVDKWAPGDAFEGFSPPSKLLTSAIKIGQPPLLGKR